MGGKLTAMNPMMAVLLLTFLLAGIWLLLEHNFRRTADLPWSPMGADADADIDLQRVRHDLEATAQAR